jgi:uncharacterized protein YdhG (YjbR/CyaY superfamily)
MPRSSPAATVDDYLATLPADRRAALTAVRDVINANLPDGYVEGMTYGMPGWHVPLARYPDTYNGQPLGIAAFASQKGYMALYLMGVYGDPNLAKWFTAAYAKAGKKLDMGKSCVRFKTLDNLPLEVIAQTIRKVPVEKFLAGYETARAKTGKPASARTKRAVKSAASAKPTSPKKSAPKKSAPRARRK